MSPAIRRAATLGAALIAVAYYGFMLWDLTQANWLGAWIDYAMALGATAAAVVLAAGSEIAEPGEDEGGTPPPARREDVRS